MVSFDVDNYICCYCECLNDTLSSTFPIPLELSLLEENDLSCQVFERERETGNRPPAAGRIRSREQGECHPPCKKVEISCMPSSTTSVALAHLFPLPKFTWRASCITALFM